MSISGRIQKRLVEGTPAAWTALYRHGEVKILCLWCGGNFEAEGEGIFDLTDCGKTKTQNKLVQYFAPAAPSATSQAPDVCLPSALDNCSRGGVA